MWGRAIKTNLAIIRICFLSLFTLSHSLLAGEIHDAVKRRDLPAVRRLIEADNSVVNEKTLGGAAALHIAAGADADDIAKALLAAGADVNVLTDKAATPLHWAAMRNAMATADLLIEQGADLEAKTLYGMRPVDIASGKALKDKAFDAMAVMITPPVYGERTVPERTTTAQDPLDDPRFTFGRAALESGDPARAYEVFMAMCKEWPGSEDVNFAVGMAACAGQKYGHAAFAFERVLSVNPGNDRARLELARVFFAKEEYALAQREFEEVLSHNPPASVQKHINTFLDRMGHADRKSGVSFRVDVAGFYDDNVNVGPDSAVIDIDPIVSGTRTIDTLTVGDDTLPISTVGLSVSASAMGLRDVGKSGKWSAIYGATGYLSLLEGKASDQEILFVNLSGGMQLTGKRHLLRVPAKFEYIAQGGNSLVNIIGVTPSLHMPLGSSGKWRLVSQGALEYRNYDQLDYRNGPYCAIGGELSRLFAQGERKLLCGATVFYEDADAATHSNVGGEIALGGDVTLPARTLGYLRFKYRTAAYSEKEALATEKRSDDQTRVILGAKKMVGESWGVGANYQYSHNSSTFALYEYSRQIITMSAFCTF